MPLLAQQHNNPKDMKKDILDISAVYLPKLSVLFRGKPFHTVSFCMMNTVNYFIAWLFFSDIINSVIEELAISNMIIIIDDSITNKPLSSTSSYLSAVSWLILSS